VRFDENMEREILLIANGDADSNAIVEAVAKQSGRRLRKVSSTRQAFEILATDMDNVDVVIIDLDPGIHSLTILRAIGGNPIAPPVIALTSLEESEVTPIASRHGAVACLSKPFQHAHLSDAIELCLALPRSVSCDLWGHPGIAAAAVNAHVSQLERQRSASFFSFVERFRDNESFLVINAARKFNGTRSD
jgi:CheY-like chemotaxis protein